MEEARETMTQAPVSPDVAEELATSLFAAIVANDLDKLRDRVYSPDVRIWHNYDGETQAIDSNLRVLAWLHRNVLDLSYEDVCRQPTPTGFVEQHVLRGTTQSGGRLEVPACLVVTVTGDRISRIDEYIDSAHIAPLMT
jgi:ketosteroid isomerase-like protein